MWGPIDLKSHVCRLKWGDGHPCELGPRPVRAQPRPTRAAAGQRERQRAEQERLEAEIQETERRLGQLQQAQAGSQATLLLSPEQEAEVDQLQDKMIAARKQLRLVQLNLRMDIEQLGTNLMLFNTIVWPLAVAVLSGLIFLMRRKVS